MIYRKEENEKLLKEYPPMEETLFGNRFKNKIGNKYGKLTVLYRTFDKFTGGKNRVQFICQCDCGNIILRYSDSLVEGKESDCGHCSTFLRYNNLKETECWKIIEHYTKDEGARSVAHSILECKKCGLQKDIRSSLLSKPEKISCKTCNMAQASGLLEKRKNHFLEILDYHSEGTGKSANPIWKCKCNRCGEITYKNTAEIKRSKSCGCMTGEPVEETVGKTYGRLTILELLPKEKDKSRRALCQCECGGFTITAVNNLKNEHTLSCGCLLKEKMNYDLSLDLAPGQRFGKLTVKEYVGVNTNRHSLYKCLCDCGTETTVLGYLLTTGMTKSCGCLQSKGEQKIAELYNNNDIEFEKEKTFDNCRFPKTDNLARFDFYLPKYNLLVEYDGVQHYQYRKNADGTKSWNTKENYEKTVERDNFKNNWCRENNFTLIRIPYIAYNQITLEDLLPGSKFTWINSED